jgi:hypothetical protein
MPITREYSSFLASFGSSEFQGLWPAQAHVLDAYGATIELPTGAGKTLIAEAWRQEVKMVAILSANKTLARQMRSTPHLLILRIHV